MSSQLPHRFQPRSATRHTRRRGSAILLCTLAAAVLSLSAIAIVRSSRHHIARTDAQRSSTQARHVTSGLVQRCIAILRVDALASGNVTDSLSPLPDAYAELTPLSPTATRVRVFLYSGSTIPAVDRVVDPTSL